jgi:hypothetical protein
MSWLALRVEMVASVVGVAVDDGEPATVTGTTVAWSAPTMTTRVLESDASTST